MVSRVRATCGPPGPSAEDTLPLATAISPAGASSCSPPRTACQPALLGTGAVGQMCPAARGPESSTCIIRGASVPGRVPPGCRTSTEMPRSARAPPEHRLGASSSRMERERGVSGGGFGGLKGSAPAQPLLRGDVWRRGWDTRLGGHPALRRAVEGMEIARVAAGRRGSRWVDALPVGQPSPAPGRRETPSPRPLRASPRSTELLRSKNKLTVGLKEPENPQEKKKQRPDGESNLEKESRRVFSQPGGVLGVIQHPGAHSGVGRGGCAKGLACPCPCQRDPLREPMGTISSAASLPRAQPKLAA